MARPQQAHADEHGELVYATPPADSLENDVSFETIPGARQQNHNGIPAWRGPLDAQIGAIENGACANEHEARNSWQKIVVALGGFGPENAAQAYQMFYKRQHEKLQAA